MKKWFAGLLALCLLVMVIPGMAEQKQEQFTTKNGFVYAIENGEVTIVGYKGTTTALDIPQAIEGYPVTAIEGFAFGGNDYLEKVTIPNSVIRLGYYAFTYCSRLKIVYIGEGVKEVGENPFAFCQDLEEIQVSPENDCLAQIDGVLYSKEDKTLLAYPAGKKDIDYAVPDGTWAIAKDAFVECNNLERIVLSSSVTLIANGAFRICENLKHIYIPASVENIGDGNVYFTFSHCPLILITVERESYAAQWAKDSGMPYQYTDADDWLNN